MLTLPPETWENISIIHKFITLVIKSFILTMVEQLMPFIQRIVDSTADFLPNDNIGQLIKGENSCCSSHMGPFQ